MRLIVRPALQLELALVQALMEGWTVVAGATLWSGQEVALLLREGWRRPGASGWT